MKTPEAFAAVLNQLLLAQDRSAAWLARQIGVDRGTVSRWVNAQTLPARREMIQLIADVLAADSTARQQLFMTAGFTEAPIAEAAAAVGPGEDPPASLPPPVTLPRHERLIGRQRELTWLTERLADDEQRLTTIWGPGGIGKTRLANEVTHHLQDQFDEIHLITFAKDSPELAGRQLAPRLSDAFNLKFDDGVSTQSQLYNALQHRRLLLILDSFEEVGEEEAELRELLGQTDALKILVTSQTRLPLAADNHLALLGLAYPSADSPEADLLTYPAVELFVEAVRKFDPYFTANAVNAAAIAAICRAVEGFPLGILLAAGMCANLSCAHVAAMLQVAPERLTAIVPGIAERHQHLYTVFESAWQQLPWDVQSIFCQLSIFNGAFSIQAVSAILDTGSSSDDFYTTSFQQLVQRALVHFDKVQDQYLLLGPLRHFARWKLMASGHLDALLDRHSQHFVQELERRATLIRQNPHAAADAFAVDLFDVRSGLLWLLKRQDLTAAVGPIDRFREFLYLQHRHQELIDFLQEALMLLSALPNSADHPATQANWQLWIGIAHYKSGQPRASKSALLSALETLAEPVGFLQGDGSRPPITRELLRQALLRLAPWRPPPTDTRRRLWELKARAFDMLGQIFFFDGQARLTEYVTVRSANLAELSHAPKELLARTLANLCVGVGLDPVVRPLAALYAGVSERLANELARSAISSDRASSSYVFTTLCLYEIALANLQKGRLFADSASRINQELGNHRQYIESVTMAINTAEFAGDFATACGQWQALRTATSQRADKQTQRWAIAGEIENRLYLGSELALDLLPQAEGATLATLLQSLIDECIAENDNSILMNLYGYLASVSLRYDLRPQLQAALRNLQIQMARQQVTKLTDFYGYVAAAAVTVTLEERAAAGAPGADLPFHEGVLTDAAAVACQSLWQFARAFPVAQCRAYTWQGVHLYTSGRVAQAKRRWWQSATRAARLGQFYEQGLALLLLAQHLPPDDHARQQHLTAAHAIFQRLGHANSVLQVEQLG